MENLTITENLHPKVIGIGILNGTILFFSMHALMNFQCVGHTPTPKFLSTFKLLNFHV